MDTQPLPSPFSSGRPPKFLSASASTASVAEVPLVRVVRDLQEELHAILSSHRDADSRELTGMIIVAERLAWQVHSVQNLLAAEAYSRSANRPAAESLSHEYGCASIHEYLQRCTLMSRREAGARIKLGSSLREDTSLTGQPLVADLPYLAVAVKAGAISPENTKMIARMLSKVSWVKGDKRDLAEKCLVEAATGIDFATGTLEDIEKQQEQAGQFNLLTALAERGLLDPLDAPEPETANSDGETYTGSDSGGDEADVEEGREGPGEAFPALAQNADSMKIMIEAWQQYLDQDGTLPDEKEALNGRYLNFGRPQGGLIPVNGRLAPEVAATFSSLIDAINSPRAQQNKNGDGEAGTIQTETSQTDEGTASADQSAGGQDLWADRPDLEGRTPAHKRHDALASLVNMASTAAEMPQHGGAPVTVLVETTQEALETGGANWLRGPAGDTTLLTPQALGHAACSGSLQYYARNAAGRLVALGNKQRIFNAHQRRAIVARDGGCVIPGCATPPAWLEIHHVHAHSEGGETHTDNGVALCWYHHRTLDTNGWQIRMKEGVPEIKAPLWIDPHQKWRKPQPPTKNPTHRRLSPRAIALSPPTEPDDESRPPDDKSSPPGT